MPSTWVYVTGSALALGGAYLLFGRGQPSSLTGALKGGRWSPVRLSLVSKSNLTHDTVLFRFALPKTDEALGLPVGQHLLFKHSSFRRPYTPISTPEEIGFMDLAVKVYKPNKEFPNGGKMSQALEKLEIGSEIVAFGPYGQLEYIQAPGQFEISQRKSKKRLSIKDLNLVAGGTGITPMYQMMRVILSQDETVKIKLIFANKTVDDIILKDQLEELQKKYPDRLSITYVITQQRKPNDLSDTRFTFVKLDDVLLKDRLSDCAGRNDCLVAVCGPPKMVKETCLPAFKSIGINEDQVYSF